MASSSSTSLTKFSSGSTIFTANLANSMYGGLYGSPEATGLAADDTRVVGHVHDGQHIDGHSQKIHLVDHVTGQITSPNIADNSINDTKIASYTSMAQAIPEYVTVGGTDYYYLDLSILRAEIAAYSVFEKKVPSTPLISPKNTDYSSSGADSFVVGSSSMDDLASGSLGDSRMFFDVESSSFRAGTVTSGEWDSSNRGTYSTAFGYNNFVQAKTGFSPGYQNSIFAGAENSAAFGSDNKIYEPNCFVFGVGGLAKSIDGSIVHSNGFFEENGDSQVETFFLRKAVSTLSPYVNISLGSILGSSFGLSDFSTFLVKGEFVLKQFNNGDTGVYTTTFVVKGIGSTIPAIVTGTPISVTTIFQDSGFSGTITINANVVAASGGGHELVFSVSDTGSRSNKIRWFGKIDVLKLLHKL